MIRLGTCSWKYDSWRAIVYSDRKNINYLREYAEHYSTVEIDQWFWSLFSPNKVVLPDATVVREYTNSVPEDFLFTIKVPNSITLTHFYNRSKNGPLIPNPYFLSTKLFKDFLKTLEPMKNKIGCLIFQFEYLNKQKMVSVSHFLEKFREFYDKISSVQLPIAIEIRNPNYLKQLYFSFLKDLNVTHVFLEGYFMPPIVEVFQQCKNIIENVSIIRLHGPDRKEIEKIANDNWNKIYINRKQEIESIVKMMRELKAKEVDLFVNVNNHFEGSAPLTIRRILEKLG